MGEKCENDFSTVHLVLNNLEQLLNQQMIGFCNTGYDPNQTELFLNLEEKFGSVLYFCK